MTNRPRKPPANSGRGHPANIREGGKKVTRSILLDLNASPVD